MGEHGGFSPLCSQYFRQNTRGNSWRLVLLGCIEHGIQALPIGELPDEGHQAFHAGDLGLILSQRQSCEQTAILNLQWIYNYIYICNIYILSVLDISFHLTFRFWHSMKESVQDCKKGSLTVLLYFKKIHMTPKVTNNTYNACMYVCM